MSLTANISPANMALTGNPIKLSINSSSLATYTILVGEQTIFTGSGEGNFFVFIQDILADIVNRPNYIMNRKKFCYRQKVVLVMLLSMFPIVKKII